jgi:hypothetical protein
MAFVRRLCPGLDQGFGCAVSETGDAPMSPKLDELGVNPMKIGGTLHLGSGRTCFRWVNSSTVVVSFKQLYLVYFMIYNLSHNT